MTRREIHGVLLLLGWALGAMALLNIRAEWLNRSDLFFLGLVIIALGLHGLWKNDPR